MYSAGTPVSPLPIVGRRAHLPSNTLTAHLADASDPHGVRALVPALRTGSGVPSVEPADKATDLYFDAAGSMLYVMEESSGTRSWTAVTSGSAALRGKTDLANYPAAERVLRDRLPVGFGDDVFANVRVEPAVSPMFGGAKYAVVGDTEEYAGVTVAELDAGGRYLGGPGAAFGGAVPAVGTPIACGGEIGGTDGDALALLSDIPTTSETLQGEDMEANPTQRQLSEAVKKIWKALGGTVICLMMCLTLFAEVTGETEWQDVPPGTPMGTVVSDLSLCTVAAARAMTNAIVHPVTSVNSKTGDVNLAAADVHARPDDWMPTAAQVGAVALVEDKQGTKTAVTIGTRMGTVGVNSLANGSGVEASGNDSHAEGSSTTASGDYSHAEGTHTIASGNGSHASGVFSKASDGHEFAFSWSGDLSRWENHYQSHGPGTFNVNPLGGAAGFWVGEETLSDIIGAKADKTAISATDPAFSNAVLAVGLGIDTNSVAVLNEIASAFGGFPIEGTATTVGGLLAALAAAVAWLKKNKADKTDLDALAEKVDAANTELEGVA